MINCAKRARQCGVHSAGSHRKSHQAGGCSAAQAVWDARAQVLRVQRMQPGPMQGGHVKVWILSAASHTAQALHDIEAQVLRVQPAACTQRQGVSGCAAANDDLGFVHRPIQRFLV